METTYTIKFLLCRFRNGQVVAIQVIENKVKVWKNQVFGLHDKEKSL